MIMKELLKRSLVGLLFILIVGAGLLCSHLLFLVLFGFALCWTMHEFYNMSMGKDFLPSRMLTTLSALMLFAGLLFCRLGDLEPTMLLLCLLPLLAAILLPIWQGSLDKQGAMAYCLAGLLIIGLPFALLPLLAVRQGVFDGRLPLALMLIVWLSDVGAYFLGTALGQRPGAWKLAPKISPKKSIWGLIGGIVMAMFCSWLFGRLGVIPLNGVHTLVFGAVLSCLGTLGDLQESMWKRYFKLKDSGNILPGHGGLFDRFDSCLTALPAAIVYLELLAPLQ